MHEILSQSNATIAFSENGESGALGHSFIELTGTINQINTAGSYLKKFVIEENYSNRLYPVILKPVNIERKLIMMPINKVSSFSDDDGIVELEMKSHAWIQLDEGPSICLVVNILGSRHHISEAITLIESKISQSCENSEKIMEIQQMYLEKYAKATLEEPNLRLPKAIPKSNFDSGSGDMYYLCRFEVDEHKYRHLAEAVAAGEQASRKFFRIRDKELHKVCDDGFEKLKKIHKISKSTVGVLTDYETSLVAQSFIELIGTTEQVKAAQELILDLFLMTYTGVMFPTLLMPHTVCRHKKNIPPNKIMRLKGSDDNNIMTMETKSGAWIELNKVPLPPDGAYFFAPKWEYFVHIYGPVSKILDAVSLINSSIYEEILPTDAESELEQLLNEVMSGEMISGTKPCFKDLENNGSWKTHGG